MLRNEASWPQAASTRFFASGLRMTPSLGQRMQNDTLRGHLDGLQCLVHVGQRSLAGPTGQADAGLGKTISVDTPSFGGALRVRYRLPPLAGDILRHDLRGPATSRPRDDTSIIPWPDVLTSEGVFR